MESASQSLQRRAGQPGGQVQHAVTVGMNLAWLVYKNLLSGTVSHVVPSHTRDACFQLFCDIRANTPKDSKFASRHIKAFTPKTPVGWLAVAAALGSSLSALLLLCTAAASISVVGLSLSLIAVIGAGIFLASALGFLTFILFSSALTVGAVALVVLSAYLAASTSLAVMRYITDLVFGPPPLSLSPHSRQKQMSQEQQQQQQQTNELANPDAPAAHALHQALAVETASAREPLAQQAAAAGPEVASQEATAGLPAPATGATLAASQAGTALPAMPHIKTKRSATTGKATPENNNVVLSASSPASPGLIAATPPPKNSPPATPHEESAASSSSSSAGSGACADDVAPKVAPQPGSPPVPSFKPKSSPAAPLMDRATPELHAGNPCSHRDGGRRRNGNGGSSPTPTALPSNS